MMKTIESTLTSEQIGTRTTWLSCIKKRVLILGSGKLAEDVGRLMRSCRMGFYYEVIGFLAGNRCQDSDRLVKKHEIIGTVDGLFELVERHRIDMVVVCMENRREQLPIQTLLDIKSMGLEVVEGHHLYEEESGRLSIDTLRPSALIFSTGFRRRFMIMALKRCVDIVISGAALLLLLPVMLVVALAIKLDSPGTIIYRQMRVGLRGRPYIIWKFRSMASDAEKAGPRWATAKDPRISKVGRWLRKWRIDEIPQFVNILKGEMSLVGPRPERPMFVQELRDQIPYYDIRHTVKPGLTGWAQTQFRYGASAEDAHVKLQYDLYYVKNLSLWLDLRILVETGRVVLLGEGAR